ncbi:hypothetical protein SLV14_006579 [Streptomyces sp. Je 1-4]|uniref:hypothetical protein n=1 Tax=Streptomyces TaxID=1883 RepID=UPI0021D9EACC|nr:MULTISPECIES: hypothetical protein [unclassified Streptomyces]UYB43585.1 hypothetical protein SLV14_006579 [Streptomyces sp. Je 1-4]UZQ39975.1 hypothetical protein SLV14N_006579 [Streptomyces sp. Je 1-4] [Streptomyces sp. Je 1-4 4N24]UZQ47392.1 hypothetical protein SLV14NA_006579 [Streptomyces sp. Je 1-4] [Streptomyces sp. Je 1-4 4N24_ara]
MSGGPVDPADVPVFTGDLDVLETKIKAFSRSGSTIETAGSDVHKSFGGLAAFYKAPEAEQLFGVTKPVEDTAHDLGEDMRVIAKALGTYAREITPLIEKFKQLKKEAADFQSNEAAEDDWSEDGDLTDENLNRRNKIAEVWTAFQEAERNCHAKIVGLVNGKALHVIDATHKTGYGYRAEDLKQAKSLPWGDAVEESIPGWQVWEHVWEFGKGFVVDGAGAGVEALKTLFGGHGGDAAGEAWLGLAKLSTGVTITTLPFVGPAYWMLPDGMLPSWLRESRTAMTETGKAFVAWDQWGSNNSRAAGAVTFNVLSAVITRGGGSAVAGAGKAATAAKAISVGSKVAQALDPMTYVAKGAGVGLSKLRGVMAGLKDAGHLATPNISDGAYSLPEGSQKLSDGTIQLPKDAAVPEGATRLPGGRIKLPEDTVTLPPGTVKSPLDGPGKYMGTDGSLYREDGSLLQKGDEAKKENVPNPKAGADTPRTETPAHQEQRVPAGVGGRGGDITHVGSDISDPARTSDNAGHSATGPRDNTPMGRAGDGNTPGGRADSMPTNSHSLGGDGTSHTPVTGGLDNSTSGARHTNETSSTGNGGHGVSDGPSIPHQGDGPSAHREPSAGRHGGGPGAGGHDAPSTGGHGDGSSGGHGDGHSTGGHHGPSTDNPGSEPDAPAHDGASGGDHDGRGTEGSSGDGPDGGSHAPSDWSDRVGEPGERANEPIPALTAEERAAHWGHLDEVENRAPEEFDHLKHDPDHKNQIDDKSMDEARVGLDLRESGRLPADIRRPELADKGEFYSESTGEYYDIKGVHSDYPPFNNVRDKSQPFKGAYDPANNEAWVNKQLAKQIEKRGRIVIIDVRNANQAAIDSIKDVVESRGWGDRVIWYP